MPQEKNKGNFPEGHLGHSYSEKYIMHKVGTAGHAGTESAPPVTPCSEPPMGEAAVGGPGLHGAAGPPASQSVQAGSPHWGGVRAQRLSGKPRTGGRGGTGVAQDCECVPFW